jgi:2-polyprenyl-6-methoxyphenol hydroxylase-like FAD-dependent oxidoreductase
VPESPAATFERLSGVLPPLDTPVLFDRAFVLGGSIAGLLAARVLADHARHVVIVERDAVDGNAPRAGVPQGRQVHNLLTGGRMQLERWFPGLTQEAQEAGAVLSGPDEFANYIDDVRLQTTRNTSMLTSSRPLLESLIRHRTLAMRGVEIVTGRVIGLAYDGDAVTGVRYVTDEGERVDGADFVVDATGRASRVEEWLEQGGRPRLGQEHVPAGVRYVTARFERSAAWSGPLVALARRSPRPGSDDGLRAALANAIEDRQWMVMLCGYGDYGRGMTREEFIARCAQLPAPFSEAATSPVIGDLVPYRYPDSRRRTFADLERFPARLVCVGDAAASFNPVFAQGMSSAALHASCLSEYLRSDPELSAPAREFFALQKVVVDAAWQHSTSGDLARLGGRHKASAQIRLERWLGRQVLTASLHDTTISEVVRAVTDLLVHPSALVRPRIVVRALLVNWRAQRAVSRR